MHKLQHKEYDAVSLGISNRAPILAIIFPLLAMLFSHKENITIQTKVIVIAISFLLSIFILSKQKIFKAIYNKMPHFKISIIAFYVYFNFIFPAVAIYVSKYNLISFLWTLLLALAFAGLILFIPYNFSHKNMQIVGWHTSDKKLLDPQIEGSPFGNKLAIILGILFLLTIILIITYG